MALWQLDLVGGIYLADGRECKVLSGIDDHSRHVVCAAVLAVPSARAVAEAFTAAMKAYGVPAEVLTDNGKQFAGRFTKPRPAEVLSGRVCREHGITAKLTRPYSPTTTGKIERWHQTLRRELLDVSGPFADLPSAQAAITAWVHAYNHQRPHQALGMASPASLFRPGSQPGPLLAAPEPEPAPEATGPAPVLLAAQAAGAAPRPRGPYPGAARRQPAGTRTAAGRPGNGPAPGPGPPSRSAPGCWSGSPPASTTAPGASSSPHHGRT